MVDININKNILLINYEILPTNCVISFIKKLYDLIIIIIIEHNITNGDNQLFIIII